MSDIKNKRNVVSYRKKALEFEDADPEYRRRISAATTRTERCITEFMNKATMSGTKVTSSSISSVICQQNAITESRKFRNSVESENSVELSLERAVERVLFENKGDLWLFAYGSLIWKPDCKYSVAYPALLRGYKRCFCIYSHTYRGTPNAPGLSLGLILDKDTQDNYSAGCKGLAFKLQPKSNLSEFVEATRVFDDREMSTKDGSASPYKRIIVKLEICLNESDQIINNSVPKTVYAISYVADARNKHTYVGQLPIPIQAGMIASSVGEFGTNIEYLRSVCEHLRNLGMLPTDDEILLVLHKTNPDMLLGTVTTSISTKQNKSRIAVATKQWYCGTQQSRNSLGTKFGTKKKNSISNLSSAAPLTKQIPVLIDVDTGIDDAHALLLALRNPRIHVLGVTTVAGNMGIEAVTAATLKVLDAADAPIYLPVAKGCEEPLVEPCHFCPQIHGTDSLGDLKPPLPSSTRTLDERHAVTLILDNLLEIDKSNGKLPKMTIIALAPLTNIAMAIRLKPRLCRRSIHRIVWMGGSAFAGGNASAWAEANAAYDPEAAHIVFTSGIEIMLYTWDVYLKVEYSWKELLELGVVVSESPIGIGSIGNDNEKDVPPTSVMISDKLKPWSSLGSRLLLRDMRYWKNKTAQIGDAGAVAAVIAPHAVTTKHMHVCIELQGKNTRGMTVCDHRLFSTPPDLPILKPNVHVCIDVDANAIKDVFTSTLFKK